MIRSQHGVVMTSGHVLPGTASKLLQKMTFSALNSVTLKLVQISLYPGRTATASIKDTALCCHLLCFALLFLALLQLSCFLVPCLYLTLLCFVLLCFDSPFFALLWNFFFFALQCFVLLSVLFLCFASLCFYFA